MKRLAITGNSTMIVITLEMGLLGMWRVASYSRTRASSSRKTPLMRYSQILRMSGLRPSLRILTEIEDMTLRSLSMRFPPRITIWLQLPVSDNI
jgi:hypothetical protein